MILESLHTQACKTYLVADKEGGFAALIDPALDRFEEDMKMLKWRKFTLTHVIDTHTHADHISACAAWKDVKKCAYVMHESSKCGCVNELVSDGDIIKVGDVKIYVYHTPGHTGDSLCLKVGDNLFTGDLLFLDDAGGGRDDLPGGDARKHYDSLQKILSLPHTVMVYPAHEYRNRKPSTLTHQCHTNPHLKHKTKQSFVQYIEDLRLGPAEWMKDVLAANQSCATDPGAAWIPVDLPACEIKGTMEENVNTITVIPISPDILKRMLDLNKNTVKANPEKGSKGSKGSEKWLILDVREPEELKGPEGHLEGVKNVPIGRLTHELEALEKYKEGTVVVVCRSGSRAATGARILMSSGFKNVKVLEGGMVGWNKANFPVRV